jgi:intracellular septation protein A
VPGDGIDDPVTRRGISGGSRQLLVEQVNLGHLSRRTGCSGPIAINLGFYTLTPLNGLLSIPLQLAFGLITANNLLLLSSFVLSGYGAFLLARRLLDMLWAEERAISDVSPTPSSAHLLAIAFFAGLIYAFAAPKLFYASLGQFNIASSQWIPFCALFLLGMMTGQTRRTVLHNSLFASLFLVAQAWAELTYASFLLIFLASAFLWSIICWVADHRQRAAWFRWQVLGYGLIGLVFAIGISPFLWAMLPDLRCRRRFLRQRRRLCRHLQRGRGWAILLPTRLHPLASGTWAAGLPFPKRQGAAHFSRLHSALLLARRWGRFALLRSRTAQAAITGHGSGSA